MAKEKTGTDVAVKDQEQQLPAYLEGKLGYTGAEDIENTDITIPRIKIGQAMTPEVKEGDLNEGDLFLNITGEVLAPAGEPLRCVIVARGKEYMLWRDRNFEGGGIMARAKRGTLQDGTVVYFWDKPNQEFINKLGGKTKVTWATDEYLVPEEGLDAWGSEIPGDDESGKAATAHHNYVVMLPDHGNMIAAFSLSKTQAKRARDLNAMLKLGVAPMYARMFTATSDVESGDGNTWANIKFKPAGYVQDKATFEWLENMHKQYKGTGFTVDQSDEEGGASEGSDEENF